MTRTNPNVAMNSLELRSSRTHVLRRGKEGLTKHEVRGGDSCHGSKHLGTHVAHGVRQPELVLEDAGQGDRWIEMSAGDGTKRKNERNQHCSGRKRVGKRRDRNISTVSLSPMMPEPTTAASSSAVPKNSAPVLPAKLISGSSSRERNIRLVFGRE